MRVRSVQHVSDCHGKNSSICDGCAQRDSIMEECNRWVDAFRKHGFNMHPGLTPEENAAEFAAQLAEVASLAASGERERCAKIVDRWAEAHLDWVGGEIDPIKLCRDIADQVRNAAIS